MTHDSQPTSPLFTQVDITAGAHLGRARDNQALADEQTALLRSILAALGYPCATAGDCAESRKRGSDSGAALRMMCAEYVSERGRS